MQWGEQLAWGLIAPGRYAVALGDVAIGLVHGNEEFGFTAQLMDGWPVGGVYDHLDQAVAAVHHAATQVE